MPDPDKLLADLEGSGMRLGLERVRSLLAALDEPQSAFQSVLVAGTNGKGTTAVHLAAMLSAAGLRTGLYTSPHLETVEERIRVDGQMIDRDRLGGILQRITHNAADAGLDPPTYFEAVTVAALLHFAEVEVDLAVLEVGLGGRLDATNVVEPVMSVITEIALDHQQHLGPDLTSIAREKAGILRPGVPCCFWISSGEARAAVEAAAEQVGAPLVNAAHTAGTIDATGGSLMLQGLGMSVLVPEMGGGMPRAANLTLALAAAETLAREAPAGLPIELSASLVEPALAGCRWPGRHERVERPDGGRAVLDGAHNLRAVEALLPALEGEHVGAVFGALEDKQPGQMLATLAPALDWVVLTRPDNDRAADPRELASGLDLDATVIDEPAAALDAALARVEPGELLLVCGSLYLVGEVRGLLRERWGRPEGMERVYGG